MRPSLGLLCSAGLWGAPTRATATGPLQGPGNTPLLVYAHLFSAAPSHSSSGPCAHLLLHPGGGATPGALLWLGCPAS